MSDLKLSIGGRYYTVACADGEEDHIRNLASMIDDKLTQMGSNLSTNEAKNLLFAGLFLADELHEARKSKAPEGDNSHLASRLERVATALENAATTLEAGG